MNRSGMTVGCAPHAFEVRSASRSLWMLSACLLAPILQSSLTDGFSSMLVAFSAVTAALLVEVFLAIVRDKDRLSLAVKSIDGSAVVTALALTLMMPNRVHPIIPAVGAAFAVLVVKHSFGGLGSNWLNPAAGAWLFLRYTWGYPFDAALVQSPLSILFSATAKGVADPSGSPLAVLKIAGWKPTSADERVTAWLNDTFLSGLGASLPSGYIDLFASPAPGLIVERGLFVLLCATIVMVASGLVSWRLPAVFVAAYLASARVWGGLPFGGGLFSGDMLHALLSGSVVLSAFVLLSDSSSGSKTRGVGVAVAAFAGVAAFWFYSNGRNAYGALLAVPAANLAAVVLRTLEERFYFGAGDRK